MSDPHDPLREAERIATAWALGECDVETARRSIAALLAREEGSQPRVERIAAALEARVQTAHRATNLVAGIVLNVDFACELAENANPDLRTALGHAKSSARLLGDQIERLTMRRTDR